MKLLLSGKSLSFHLLRYAGVGPAYRTYLVFFQVLGNSQAVRGLKYILSKKQATHFDMMGARYYGTLAYLARGKWQVEVSPKEVQGVTMHLLTAYIPFGSWGANEERYFFVAPGRPGPAQHDVLFRRWAEQFTPYPIPPSLSLAHVLRGADWAGSNDEAPVLVSEGKGLGETPDPWVVAIKTEAFEEILREVSYAA